MAEPTTCRAEYQRPGGRLPGDRIVRCDFPPGHRGDHEEADTGNTWVNLAAEAEPGTEPAVLGYMVLIHDDKRPGWHDDWDGEVHPDLNKARQSLAEARKAGYEAVLTEQRAMEGE